MQHGSINKACIVVWVVNFQDFLHTLFQVKSEEFKLTSVRRILRMAASCLNHRVELHDLLLLVELQRKITINTHKFSTNYFFSVPIFSNIRIIRDENYRLIIRKAHQATQVAIIHGNSCSQAQRLFSSNSRYNSNSLYLPKSHLLRIPENIFNNYSVIFSLYLRLTKQKL